MADVVANSLNTCTILYNDGLLDHKVRMVTHDIMSCVTMYTLCCNKPLLQSIVLVASNILVGVTYLVLAISTHLAVARRAVIIIKLLKPSITHCRHRNNVV